MLKRIPAIVAAALALVVLYAGARWGSTVAGGADSSGYVSQAGLWRAGGLMVRQDLVAESPWPIAQQTWTPLGYVPSTATRDAIVPWYAPGFPLLMALAQLVAGYCAAFVVVPVCGALTIWSTYRLGARLFGSAALGLGGAVLVAASPVFLYQLMNPMSDVPAAAAWTVALACAVAGFPLCAGLSTALVIAIRPNLAPLALVLFAWLAVTKRAALVRAAIGVAPAVIGIAWLNARLYGSPFVSGYGSLGDIYAIGNVPGNVKLFTEWTLGVQTPAILIAALYFVAPRLLRSDCVPAARVLLSGTIAVVVASYLFYRPFEVWSYLRFLLPAWPVLLLLTAAGIDALARRWTGVWAPVATASVVAALAVHGVFVADQRGAFAVGRGERQYVDVARFVAARTEPDAVVLSMQHSNALRIYADRLTLRYDLLDPLWLERAIERLQSLGRHPYLVLTAFEETAFRERFGAASPSGALDWQPIAVYSEPRIAIYDAVNRTNAEPPLAIAPTGRDRARWRCEPPQIWPPRLRMK